MLITNWFSHPKIDPRYLPFSVAHVLTLNTAELDHLCQLYLSPALNQSAELKQPGQCRCHMS